MLTIVIVLAMLLGLAMCGYKYWEVEEQRDVGALRFMLASAASQPIELSACTDEQMRERIKTMMLESLDDALKAHFQRMFEVWQRDDRGQPTRARSGVQQGIAAYLNARKLATEWAPPVC
jgi:hypothetical protein